ncbi:MAG: hypothetical protein B6241_04725 [Spirochaetaceae bacterium 4572_59]|nr:MAG: hypothetical protein B6241_04725 [Spirochaetaceae bacterium 4572_59]
MDNIVIYSSRNGNSKLIAEAIAEELDCGIVNLNEVKIEDIDLKEIDTIFLGSGIYGGTVHREILNFGKFLNINNLNRTEILKIAFFITWLGRGKSDMSGIKRLRKILQSVKFDIQADYFSCFGKSFKFIRRSHPDKNDINNAKAWAKKIVAL